MKKKKILIIGKNSFIGHGIYSLANNKLKFKKISYENIDKVKLNKFSYIINTSIKEGYIKKKYNKKNDIDISIAKKIDNYNTKYIFMSSRKIYNSRFNITENSRLSPNCNYSKNKVKTEDQLKNLLGNKLLILRTGNVIGLKKKKNYRQQQWVFLDNFLKMVADQKKHIFYDEYKDFISITQFSKIVHCLISKNITGTFNISMGKKTFISEIIKWLLINNKNKIVIKKNYKFKDSFTLNNSKLKKVINFPILKKDLNIFCLKLGRELKNITNV